MKRTKLMIAVLGLFLLAQMARAEWAAAKRLTWTSGDSSAPAVAEDSKGAVHVVWEDSYPGNDEIYYRSSPDGGVTWNSTRRLTWTSGDSTLPAIAVDPSDAIHIVWEDSSPGNLEIYYKNSPDGGIGWDAARRLTWTSGGSYFPALAIDSNNHIHIVWHDDTPRNAEIYYKGSLDGGANWSSTQRLTLTEGSSACPAIAAGAGDTLHLVWSGGMPGNYEIYHKKGT